MKTLLAYSELEVDQIIQKVMIRTNSNPYNYSKYAGTQLTPQQHIWHYQLQQENLELKTKIKELKTKCRKKQQNNRKQTELENKVEGLKKQLQELVAQNNHTQKEIDRLRMKNNSLNDSLRQSLEESERNRSKRECSCSREKQKIEKPKTKQKIGRKRNRTVIIESPSKSILKEKDTKQASVTCQLENYQIKNKIDKKKQHILQLKKVIQNQEKLIASYLSEIKSKSNTQTMVRYNTRPSTSRFQPLSHPTSVKTFRPLSSVGSIVKIRKG